MKDQAKKSILVEIAVVMAIALLLLVIMPLVLTEFRLNLLGRFLSLAIVGLGLDLIWGYTGLLSLGHGIFFWLRWLCHSHVLKTASSLR